MSVGLGYMGDLGTRNSGAYATHFAHTPNPRTYVPDLCNKAKPGGFGRRGARRPSGRFGGDGTIRPVCIFVSTTRRIPNDLSGDAVTHRFFSVRVPCGSMTARSACRSPGGWGPVFGTPAQRARPQ